MAHDPELDVVARLGSKAQHIGWLATVRMGFRKALRPWRKSRHRAHVLQRPYRVDRQDLAVAFGVTLEALPAAAERMRTVLAQRLPVSSNSVAAIRAFYEQQAPRMREATIESADRICDHVFDLLGSGPVALGATIDWHRDFKSGYRWNPELCFLDVAHGHEAGVDIKVPWELSRGHHLVLLAQATLLTGDHKYARECLRQLSSWIEANPTGYGVNWACPGQRDTTATDITSSSLAPSFLPLGPASAAAEISRTNEVSSRIRRMFGVTSNSANFLRRLTAGVQLVTVL